MPGSCRGICCRGRSRRRRSRPPRNGGDMYRKILIAYDGSEASQKAFATACGLAAQNSAELFVVSVARPPEIGDEVETEAIIESARQQQRRMLTELKAQLAAKKLKAHFDVPVGHP